MTSAAELTAPVALCDADGRLHPGARGWARQPLFTCNLGAGQWPRKKRWHHWGVLDDAQYITFTVADLDIFSVAVVMAIDLASGKRQRRIGMARGGRGRAWPLVPGGGAVRFAAQGLTVALVDGDELTTLAASWRGFAADVHVTRPRGHETLNVVVPHGDEHFLYSSKQTGLPARGEVTWRGRPRRFGPEALAGLDFARGVWPLRVSWHWASGAGSGGGRAIGVNLGAGWTDGSGTTENALVVDGRLQKLPGEVTFDKVAGADGVWRIRGERVDLTFTSRHLERPGANLGVFAAWLDHGIGSFTGTVVTDDGARVDVRLAGWCEQVHVG